MLMGARTPKKLGTFFGSLHPGPEGRVISEGVKMKSILFLTLLTVAFQSAFANNIRPGEDLFHVIATNSNGAWELLVLKDAITFCESYGMRLPNNRDFAAFAVLHGARMRESAFGHTATNDPKVQDEISDMKAQGLYPVYRFDTSFFGASAINGFYVDFYYDPSSFVRPNYLPYESNGFLSVDANAEYTEDIALHSIDSGTTLKYLDDPAPDTFGTNARIMVRVYREHNITCTAAE